MPGDSSKRRIPLRLGRSGYRGCATHGADGLYQQAHDEERRMEPTKLQILKQRAASFKKVLDKVPPSEKGKHVTTPIADNFNKMRD